MHLVDFIRSFSLKSNIINVYDFVNKEFILSTTHNDLIMNGVISFNIKYMERFDELNSLYVDSFSCNINSDTQEVELQIYIRIPNK